MASLTEIHLLLQNLLNRTVSQAEIGKALERGKSNISLRIKNQSRITEDEIKKIEKYFNVCLRNIVYDIPEPLQKSRNTIHSDSYFYGKLLELINSSNEKEIEYYYCLLLQAKKGLSIIKSG